MAPGPAPGGPAAPPPAPGYQPGYQSPYVPAVSQVGMGQAYQAARRLMGLQRAVTAGLPLGEMMAPEAAAPAPSGVSDALMGALNQLQSAHRRSAPQPRQSLRLRQRLHEVLQRDGVALSSEESEAVDVLTGLIEAVLVDPLIQNNVKPRIERLSVPLMKVALNDQQFFNEDAHPARQVVNRLGMLGLPETLPEGEEGDSMAAAVDPLLERILDHEQSSPQVFESVLPDLDRIIERQNERFQNNVGSIVETREQQQAMLAERRQSGASAPRRVPQEIAPWFRRTERLKVGDVVTFKAGTDEAQPRTLAWVADDHETFVFTDRSGRESEAVAQQELALEMLRGSAKVLDSPEVPAMDRGVYEMLHRIHTALSDEGQRDSVTGLMPLSAFEEKVNVAIGRAQRRGSKHALLALDLDRFAGINEKCGRKAGDSLLRKLGRLLSRQMDGQGSITRAHADQFLVLLEDHGFQDARRFAERQCRAIENSRVVFEGEQYPITVSIGLVPVTRAGESAEAMIQSVRAALAGAKRRGGNQLRIFDPDEDRLSDGEDTGAGAAAEPEHDGLGALLDAGRLVLRRQLLHAIGEELEEKPYYGVLVGLRDDAGTVSDVSQDLLLEAERDSRMADVDRWVIKTALAWMAGNRRELIKTGGYAISISGTALASDDLLEYVVEQLTESSVPPAKVVFEVKESVAIDRLSNAADFIRTLREYGCRFSVDDFGSGHTTFSYLKTLPVDYVKIDGMFVSDLAENDNDFAMVKSINEIAHLLGKHTIAERADSEPVLERLKELGVDFAQGEAVAAAEPLE
jgi:diguanylate cyclase (GGDEF)-like protein